MVADVNHCRAVDHLIEDGFLIDPSSALAAEIGQMPLVAFEFEGRVQAGDVIADDPDIRGACGADRGRWPFAIDQMNSYNPVLILMFNLQREFSHFLPQVLDRLENVLLELVVYFVQRDELYAPLLQ